MNTMNLEEMTANYQDACAKAVTEAIHPEDIESTCQIIFWELA